ncbi:abortive infection system antitoxin AbiGi family protein [Bacillus sp. B3-WWTP-C-10-D-3]|uniref:abortive infection system antitoxin AbiGi family protein n=1 Tax=Bacillus sp. B3-WWTP-C-10-D-3 TaxID=2653217 RepID=UPI001262653A|nr:abortive infection system antitoxin AbiGi family protein [Bacillus sp. B3-WWTP-C-10-D-3]KAB7635297.1 hypothetical protein GBN83_25005 [Bacillus sp. B3-WWTP-C-10-D-3]
MTEQITEIKQIDAGEMLYHSAKDELEKDLSSKQSANALFNFTKKFEWLTKILENKAFIPRYNEEKIDNLKLGDMTEVVFPMTCFCDIHLKRLGDHMFKYGGFGIGLEKEWGIKSGVQPIQYLNISSNLANDFSKVFTKALDNISEESSLIAEYQNFLLHKLVYLKPLEGSMKVSDDEYADRNFHDEREWRYVPYIKSHDQDDLPLIIPGGHLLSPEAPRSYSLAISKRKELWLNFDYCNVKYLFVIDERFREQLIRFITDKLDIEMYEKMLLISKIVVWNDIKKDW